MGLACLYSGGRAKEELVNEVYWKRDNSRDRAIYFTGSYLHGKTT